VAGPGIHSYLWARLLCSFFACPKKKQEKAPASDCPAGSLAYGEKLGATSLLHPVFPLASAASQSGKIKINGRLRAE